jgi:hypothetical protein
MLLLIIVIIDDVIQKLFDFDVALGDFQLQMVVSFKLLLKGKKVILATIGLKGPGNFLFGASAIVMEQFG